MAVARWEIHELGVCPLVLDLRPLENKVRQQDAGAGPLLMMPNNIRRRRLGVPWGLDRFWPASIAGG